MEYEGDREGVTVLTEAKKNTVSHLLVRNATITDTGQYTCKPSNGRRASINLHVLEGGGEVGVKWGRGGGDVGVRSGRCGGEVE